MTTWLIKEWEGIMGRCQAQGGTDANYWFMYSKETQ